MGPDETSDFWRDMMLGTSSSWRLGRSFFRRIPSDPRCKMCLSPFAGPGAPVMRLVGKGRWPKNPNYCSQCFTMLLDHPGGAEVECSFLFADVRGSTPLAERLGATEVRRLMDRFFTVAAPILVATDAIVDKFVGDEVVGIFVPALAGDRHAARAIDAARRILVATGNDGPDPWLPVGAGVNTGRAFIGTVGEAPQIELTALGDPVNVAARLASAAGQGEVLVTLEAAAAADLDTAGLEQRDLELKGKVDVTQVVVVRTVP